MTGKTLVEIQTPVTQTVDAVKALLAYMHRPAEPLPEFVELDGRVRLTRSKDGKAYYLTTTKDCSCPARAFNPGKPCKHMRALLLSLEEREDDLLPERSQAFRPYDDEKIPRLQVRPGAVVA